MRKECDICGKEDDERFMEHYNAGSKTIWLCWHCYKNAQYEANKSNLYRQSQLFKIMNSKKRNKG